ncbi:hypothetical protein E2C01_065251 [Portunus trituberculatus]|uniref:Uncharacterized protein n=1 Tax=Portunus trituberculatus TaxID=210409 RepID=A0A5B7HR68_PORTR|nr:hypothetical protein [Portunus trituberculatus]
MVNFLFDDGLREEDYKAICEDEIVKKPKNCHTLAPVECNPQLLEALKLDTRKTDFCLREVNKDILRASTIITKYLVALEDLAEQEDNSKVAHEVSMINGALALLGNANHRNNLVRCFVMKREINYKYAHLCSDKVSMSRFLFGDDVSQSARQIEEADKLRTKFSQMKPAFPFSSQVNALVDTGTNLLVRASMPVSAPMGNRGLALGLLHNSLLLDMMRTQKTPRAGAAAAGNPSNITGKYMF